MKIALIGNMNNNFFSMLRYFRDLGLDAYLFLYKNEQKYFLPEYDTWQLNKWNHYIIQTELYNGVTKNNISILYIPKRRIRKLFSGFDILIGTGAAPIYLNRAGLKLDLFIPYASYVEFTKNNYTNIRKLVGSIICNYLQSKGIKKIVARSISAEIDTKNRLVKLGQNPIPYGIPMVYNYQLNNSIPKSLNSIIERMSKSDFVIFSHVSHIWKEIPKEWKNSYTRNDIIIKAFSEYLKYCQRKYPILVLFEYGPDVWYSKELIKNLGISENILWLQVLKRKEIFILLDHVDIGCGKVGGMSIWGGVGWEFMSKGIPFFWNLTVSKEKYENSTGNPLPPLLKVSNSNDIKAHLLEFEKNPEHYKKIGYDLKKWFDKYGGIGLAEKYNSLIQEIYNDKMNE